MTARSLVLEVFTLAIAALTLCQICIAQESPSNKAKYMLADKADLRILNNNIWEYSQDTIPPKWQEMGEDPRDFVRAPQFVKMITERMPDVFSLQEYAKHMHDEFYHRIKDAGYEIAWESKEDWKNTPIYYYSKTIEPLYVNYHKYTPEQWCNRGTKSFTSAVLKRMRILDGKSTFIFQFPSVN